MAAAVDLKTTASLPIRLGASFSNERDGARYANVRYNHKPRLRNADAAECTIKPGKEAGESRLVLKDDGDEYRYNGQHGGLPDSYVLVIKGQGKNKEAVLERVAQNHVFNLVRSSNESDAAKLEERYPHISPDEDDDGQNDEDDLFGHAGEAASADPGNPFDYRHFLKAEKAEATKERSPEIHKRTAAEIQLSHSRAGTAPVAHQPMKRTASGTSIFQKKRKAPAPAPVATTSKDALKRTKASEPPSASLPSPTSNPKPSAPPKAAPATKRKLAVPEVRLERKATVPVSPGGNGELTLDPEPGISLADDGQASDDNDFDDDTGELILEDNDAAPPRHQTAMSLALSGQLRGGPISLRSAVNSPAGAHLAGASPNPPQVEEYDLGGDSESDEDQNQAYDERVGDSDADVEDLELPSPAQTHVRAPSSTVTASQSQATVPQQPSAADDDDDDMEMQLALALGEADDGPSAQAGGESEEESEEE